jgi:hypothetical protein
MGNVKLMRIIKEESRLSVRILSNESLELVLLFTALELKLILDIMKTNLHKP